MLFTSKWINIKNHLQHLISLSIFPCMFMQVTVEKQRLSYHSVTHNISIALVILSTRGSALFVVATSLIN